MASTAPEFPIPGSSQLNAAEVVVLSDRGPQRDILAAIGADVVTAIVSPGDLGVVDLRSLTEVCWVIDLDLSDSLHCKATLEQLKDLDAPRFILLRTHERRGLLRAQDLSPIDFFFHPFSQDDLGRAVRQFLNGEVEKKWERLTQTQRAALRVSLKCFETASELVASGQPLPEKALKDCTLHILAATQEARLDDWMAALRGHHNYTFRHSMFVTGTITTFAYWLGIRGQDLERLALGALLHDIGKAQVPTALLDKPGALSPNEWHMMQNHAEYSRMILASETWIDPNVVSMAVHHHERLDGSGYPDGLKGSELNDFVRMTAIGDTFSALIDKRSYKPAMSNDKSIRIMSCLKEELDQDIVRKFREFILG